MPTFFTDPPPNTFIYFAIAAIVSLGFWLVSKWRIGIVLSCTAFAWILLLLVCDLLFESPREQAVRKMKEIAKLTQEKKLDDAFKHLSESFTLGTHNKKALLDFAKLFVNEPAWAGVVVDEFDRRDAEMVNDQTVRIGFTIRPGGPFGMKREFNYYCRGTFVKEPDGQFRLLKADLYRNRPGPNDQPVMPDQMR